MSVPIKTYSKTELADLYKVNKRTLANWIARNEKLQTEIKQIGYKKTQRSYSPKQVELIFKYIGTP